MNTPRFVTVATVVALCSGVGCSNDDQAAGPTRPTSYPPVTSLPECPSAEQVGAIVDLDLTSKTFLENGARECLYQAGLKFVQLDARLGGQATYDGFLSSDHGMYDGLDGTAIEEVPGIGTDAHVVRFDEPGDDKDTVSARVRYGDLVVIVSLPTGDARVDAAIELAELLTP